jgi:F-type H+-transporting ATPase subunit alpha
VNGFLDDLPLLRVLPFEKALLKHIHDEFPEIREELIEKGALGDELIAKIKEVVGHFKKQFVSERADATVTA